MVSCLSGEAEASADRWALGMLCISLFAARDLHGLTFYSVTERETVVWKGCNSALDHRRQQVCPSAVPLSKDKRSINQTVTFNHYIQREGQTTNSRKKANYGLTVADKPRLLKSGSTSLLRKFPLSPLKLLFLLTPGLILFTTAVTFHWSLQRNVALSLELVFKCRGTEARFRRKQLNYSYCTSSNSATRRFTGRIIKLKGGEIKRIPGVLDEITGSRFSVQKWKEIWNLPLVKTGDLSPVNGFSLSQHEQRAKAQMQLSADWLDINLCIFFFQPLNELDFCVSVLHPRSEQLRELPSPTE